MGPQKQHHMVCPHFFATRFLINCSDRKCLVASSMEGSMLCLDDACLECILSCTEQLNHLDLLRCARVCRRLNRVACTAEQAWAACYQQQYGTVPVLSAAGSSYRQLFRERCVTLMPCTAIDAWRVCGQRRQQEQQHDVRPAHQWCLLAVACMVGHL